MFNNLKIGASEVRRPKLLRFISGVSSKTLACTILNARNLMTLKQKALRRGLWYIAIGRLDRVLVDLTIKVSNHVRSDILAKGLLSVTQKLLDAFENKLERVTRLVGLPIAQKVSLFAQGWNYQKAEAWATDQNFARYLAIMDLNGFAV